MGCTGIAPLLAGWAGGDDIHLQRGVQVLGPLSEPGEDLRFLIRRWADDRPLPERARLLAGFLAGARSRGSLMAANLCEGATLLARRLHMRDEVARALGQLTERWDGKGFPGEAAGEAIARPLRIVRVAHDLVVIAGERDRDGGGRGARGAAAGAAMTRRSSTPPWPGPTRWCGRPTFPTRGSGCSTPSRGRSRRSRRPG